MAAQAAEAKASAAPEAEPPAEPAAGAEASAAPEAEAPAEPAAGTEAPAAEGTEGVEEEEEEMVDDDAPTPAGKEEAKVEEAPKAKKWTCVSCGASNFATASECHKCGAPKPSKTEMALVDAKAAAKEDVKKAMDEFLRLQADLQNYRRQHESEMSKAQDLGMQDALRKLVPFSLDVEEALVKPEGLTEKESNLFQSYSILFRKVQGVWDKFGVKPLTVQVGDKFDPIRHRKAESREPEGDQVAGTILEVLEQGWTCDGKVLIPSEVVIVAFPAPKEEASKPAEEGATAGEEAAAEEEE